MIHLDMGQGIHQDGLFAMRRGGKIFVLETKDRVTRTAGVFTTGEFKNQKFVEMMIGRAITTSPKPKLPTRS